MCMNSEYVKIRKRAPSKQKFMRMNYHFWFHRQKDAYTILLAHTLWSNTATLVHTTDNKWKECHTNNCITE